MNWALQPPPRPAITDPDIAIAREAVCRSHHDLHPESPWHQGQAENVRSGLYDYNLDVMAAYEAVKMMRAPAKLRITIRQDGYIRHTPGDECPVPPWMKVQVIVRGYKVENYHSEGAAVHYSRIADADWWTGSGWCQIIAYRLVR